MQTYIHIQGAREHNLKNIHVDIPRDKLVVITGLSGSGKSSLAFDTLYAEGQRRYVESLSAYARQFLELMPKPDVDLIEGLSPAIAIEQKTTSKNPRSTVGTVTEIYDYLRLLFARVGIPHSPATGLPIQSQTISQMVDQLMELPEGTKVILLAPIVRGRKGEYRKELLDLKKRGFQRVQIDGTMHDLDSVPTLSKNIKHDIDAVVDRLVIKPDIANRLADTLETALRLSDGLAYAQLVDLDKKLVLSSRYACPESGFSLDEIEPRLFSFNNPHGACPTCDGLGIQTLFAPELVIPNPKLSLSEGAIAPWAVASDASSYFYQQLLESIAKHYEFSLRTPFEDLSSSLQSILLYGSQSPVSSLEKKPTKGADKKAFEGIIPGLERRLKKADNYWTREELRPFQTSQTCQSCLGQRLKPEALTVKIHGMNISQVTHMGIEECATWFGSLDAFLTSKQQEVAARILKEIKDRLGFLISVGLNYLTLSRTAGTLSGGESQRIRLASQIGSGLTGVLYVLDEPSIGLHQRDNDRLLATLKHLRDLGNTVLVVEHDEDTILAADFLIDMGPGAGSHGGYIVSQGCPTEVMKDPQSLTGQYLTHARSILVPASRRPWDLTKVIHIQGASENNLQNVSVDFPLSVMTCVTGVSGSGKSSLVIETLYKGAAAAINRSRGSVGTHESIKGLEHIDKVIDIDQSPIGRTPRSNPATYTGAFTPIREWFAGLPEAKARGYGPGRFSFNVKGGRCEACQGDGVIKIEMHFLPDVYVECDQCRGKRYNRETLEIKFQDQSIADVLDMTIEEAVQFFENMPSIRDKLKALVEVGLSYIKVGQQATTLSGGEAQRVKLAKELARKSTGKTLYILDEPTTGLHFEDVRKLLEVLHAIVDQKNTVIIIEHNLEVIKTSDWIIDVGPEGGTGGGKIIAQGTPEDVAKVAESYTGQYLAPLLAKARAKTGL
jgi:excinuclease ABC subunit A